MSSTEEESVENIILLWSSEVTGERRDMLSTEAKTLVERLTAWHEENAANQINAVLDRLEEKAVKHGVVRIQTEDGGILNTHRVTMDDLYEERQKLKGLVSKEE